MSTGLLVKTSQLHHFSTVIKFLNKQHCVMTPSSKICSVYIVIFLFWYGQSIVCWISEVWRFRSASRTCFVIAKLLLAALCLARRKIRNENMAIYAPGGLMLSICQHIIKEQEKIISCFLVSDSLCWQLHCTAWGDTGENVVCSHTSAAHFPFHYAPEKHRKLQETNHLAKDQWQLFQ